MMNPFDDLARAIASGISRREALKRMGAGLTGLLLSSVGLKKAFAAPVTCGTCQACDLDTGTCGLACNPAAAGATLCSMASQDGSYQRLITYLTSNGFEAPGASLPVLLYEAGALYQSALGTVLQNATVSNEIARVGYLVSPTGGIICSAVVVKDLIPVYALSVDFNGRIIQTIATQTVTTKPSQTPAIVAHPAVLPSRALTLPKSHASVVPNDLVSQETCNRLIDIVCGVIDVTIICWLIGEAACAAGAIVTLGTIEIPCALAVGLLCAAGGYAACEADKALICACDYNEQSCGGVCCDQCQDCLNGSCVAGANVSSCPSGVCCGGICCDAGYICDPSSNTCVSPNAGCVGATCETFVPCSSSNPDCVCGTIAEGGGLCVPGSTACDGLAPCSSSADCGADALCLIGSCCGQPVCVPVALSEQCPSDSTTSAARQSAAVKTPSKQTGWAGPTIGHR